MMGCCKNAKPSRENFTVKIGGFTFKGFLSYCGGCGLVRPENTTIFDGKLNDE